MIQYASAIHGSVELFNQKIDSSFNPDEDPILRDAEEDDAVLFMADLDGFTQFNDCWEKGEGDSFQRLFFHKLTVMK